MNKKLHSNCPIARVAVLLSDAWTMLIVRDLLSKRMRFSDLEKSLAGISTRTLTNKIKQLEAEGVLEKIDPHYYSITKKGSRLKKVLDAMAYYGKNIDE